MAWLGAASCCTLGYLRHRNLDAELWQHGPKLVEVDEPAAVGVELPENLLWRPLHELRRDVLHLAALVVFLVPYCAPAAAAMLGAAVEAGDTLGLVGGRRCCKKLLLLFRNLTRARDVFLHL